MGFNYSALKSKKKFFQNKKTITFAIPFGEVAQLVRASDS